MNTKLTCILASAALFGGLHAANTTAAPLDEGGIYVGSSYGLVSVDNSDFEDDDNEVTQLFVGGMFNPFIGVELSRIDFGNYGNSFASASTDGYGLALTARLPITDWMALYGKAGQFFWETDVDVLGFDDKFDGREPYYGAGLLFGLNDHIQLNVSYERMNVDLEEDEIGSVAAADFDSEVNTANIGLRFSF